MSAHSDFYHLAVDVHLGAAIGKSDLPLDIQNGGATMDRDPCTSDGIEELLFVLRKDWSPCVESGRSAQQVAHNVPPVK